mmetsp:Transcript_18394/g.28692  ORF Transcript_18394/g.28692 Transcript_18394/m.28692 type:complete len:222 (-) Transcript_18394:76-741(-)
MRACISDRSTSPSSASASAAAGSSAAAGRVGRAVGAVFISANCPPVTSSKTFWISSSLSSSIFSGSRSSNVSCIISSIISAFCISCAIDRIVSAISGIFTKEFIWVMNSVLFSTAPANRTVAIWFPSCMSMEFMLALVHKILSFAFLDLTISFARICAAPSWLSLAAFLASVLIFFSSLSIVIICLSSLRISDLMDKRHALTCSLRSGPFLPSPKKDILNS